MRLTIKANGHSVDIDIPPYPFANWRKVTLTQVVFQKDYPMVWIRDHALFHHRAHGYERMVVYDNGSGNVSELKDCLAQLDEGLEVLLIRWPFPWYRPHIQQRLTKNAHDICSQRAAFNHHMHLLAPRSTYVSQFDLDEYLFNRSGKPLVDYLTNQDKDEHYVWTERVANVTDSRDDIARAADFKWQSRDNTVRHSDNFYKYIYLVDDRVPKSRFADIHFLLGTREPQYDYLDGLARYKLMRYLLSKLRLWNGGMRFEFMETAANRRCLRERRQAARYLVLFHYDGIRTDWGNAIEAVEKSSRGERLSLDHSRHKRFDEMPQLLRRLKLADEDD